MTDVERKRKFIINIIYYVILGFIGLLLVKYAFGVCFPIFFAFVVAFFLQRPKNFLVRKTFLKNGTASTLCVIAMTLLVLALVALIGVRVAEEVKSFIDYVMMQFQNIDVLINNVEVRLSSIVAGLPDFLSKSLSESLANLFTQVREFVAGTNDELSSQITSSLSGSFSLSWITAPLSGVISTAKQIPSVVIAIVISIVAACFMTAEFDKVRDFIILQFPEEKRDDFIRAKNLLKNTLTKMCKAYLLIMLITFCELFLGFTVLKLLGIFNSSYIFIICVVTTIVDIIPILGTGTILLPWTAYSLIVGNYAMAIGLIIIYATITVIRQIIEPKLVAGQLGLSPIVTLTAMYIGLKVFGVLGIFIGPILIIMLKLLNDEGIIRLWKSPSREKARLEKAAAEQAAKKENKAEKA